MIYLIENQQNSAYKIGFSENPEKRLKALQTSNPTKLKLVATLEGDQQLEKEFHKKFKDFRLLGEWFENKREILDSFFNSTTDKDTTRDYIKINLRFSKLIQQIGELKIFGSIMTHCYFDSENIYTHTAENAKSLGMEYKLKDNTVHSYIRLLIASGLLYRVGKSQYKVNSDYVDYSKGKLKEGFFKMYLFNKE